MQTYTAEQLLSPSYSDLLDEIVLLISHTFTEDPNTKWIFSNLTRAQYISVLPAYFRFTVRAALLSGATVTVIQNDPTSEFKPQPTTKPEPTTPQQQTIKLPQTSTIRALGVLIPPSGIKSFESIWTLLRAGLLTLPFKCGFTPLYKVITQIATGTNEMNDRIFPDPEDRHHHWHLLFLATHPDSQGQGLGKKILTEFQGVVRKAEEGKIRKAVLSLEAGTAGSQRLYRRVGFVDRDSVPYGECVLRGGDESADGEGRVTGGRMFGMTWAP